MYEVGHRLTDRFDDVPVEQQGSRTPRVFITGDACHTHSAKAGQGMNVSMQDGWNIGWKLGHVLDGRSPERLLETYHAERHVVAKDLIDFDKEWSTLMAKKPEEFENPSELEDFYVSDRRVPGRLHDPVRAVDAHRRGRPHQALATGFPIGKRFKSAPVERVADGNPVHLGHHHRADGRWRIYVFADAAAAATDASVAGRWAQWFAEASDSPLLAAHAGGRRHRQHLRREGDLPAGPHRRSTSAGYPTTFLPRTGPFELIDYEKVYAADPQHDIFELRGIDRGGAVVVVRPDHYVANVLPLTATDELAGLLPADPAAPAEAPFRRRRLARRSARRA